MPSTSAFLCICREASKMPTFLLCVKPELEGLVSFEPGEGCDWKLDFKQSAGSEERKGVVVDPQNEEEVPNAKGDTCQLVMSGYLQLCITVVPTISTTNHCTAMPTMTS